MHWASGEAFLLGLVVLTVIARLLPGGSDE